MRITGATRLDDRINFRTELGTQPVARIEKLNDSFARFQAAETFKNLKQLRESLLELGMEIKPNRTVGVSGRPAEAASATSNSILNLQSSGATFATLGSAEEINATPTSFSPRGPEFSGTSSSSPTIDGTYDGSSGTDVLTFTVIVGGAVGISPLISLEVTNSLGENVENIDLALYQPDEVFRLQNGLTLSLSAGSLTTGDEFDVSVSDSVGSSVDPDNSFDGTRNASPGFEEGVGVSAGSFEINGAVVQVAANDSINSVVGKINNSSAGVTVLFNDLTERLEIVQNAAGALPTISLNNDTSGFLAAVKLSNQNLVSGQDATDDFRDALESVSQFENIESGTITVNGIGISVDVANDSLEDVLSRITNSSAGVLAELDLSGQRVQFTNLDSQATLSLSGNATRFLEAIQVDAGQYDPVEAVASTRKVIKGLSRSKARELAQGVGEFVKSFNEIFDDSLLVTKPGSELSLVRSVLRSEVSNLIDAMGETEVERIGLEFAFNNPDSELAISFNQSDQRKLESMLRKSPEDVSSILFGDKVTQGLTDRLLSAIDDLQAQGFHVDSSVGQILDLRL